MQPEEKPAKAKEQNGGKDAKSKSTKASKKAAELDEDDDDDEDAEVADIEPHISIVHSLENDRYSHMGASAYEEVGCFMTINTKCK